MNGWFGAPAGFSEALVDYRELCSKLRIRAGDNLVGQSHVEDAFTANTFNGLSVHASDAESCLNFDELFLLTVTACH